MLSSSSREERNARVDHLYATLEPVHSVKVSLSTSSSQNLRLDDELVGACARR